MIILLLLTQTLRKGPLFKTLNDERKAKFEFFVNAYFYNALLYCKTAPIFRFPTVDTFFLFDLRTKGAASRLQRNSNFALTKR